MAELLEFPAVVSSYGPSPQEIIEEENASCLPDDDAAVRDLALHPERSFLVEAPAGSGKTGLLMQRFLNLLGHPGTTAPEEILAITFTRKATAELRERILHQLEAAAASAALPDPGSAFDRKTRALAVAALERDRQLGWDLLTNPRRLRIQTIDSLCMEIAGTLPLFSGSAARSPVDDASELYRRAARNTLRQLGGDDRPLHDALHTVLLHRDGNLGDVESLLAEMLATREQWAELVPLDRASLTDDALGSSGAAQQVRLRLERTLEQIVCAGLGRALRLIPQAALKQLAGLAHMYADEPPANGKGSPVSVCRDHPGPPAAEAAHLDHWRALLCLLLTKEGRWRKLFHKKILGFELSSWDKERLKGLVEEIQTEPLREALEAVRCLPPARYPDDQWHQAKALFRLLLHALAELKLLFAETGECDFTEFSLAARQALAHHAEDYTASSGAVLRHLLVDEMQDTSSAQYDLLTALTRSWDGSSQTLFLVGDPKQSIYLFRQARVERFLLTTRDRCLGDVPLQPLQLTANFRSRPALVEGVNRDAAELFTLPGQPLAADTADVPFVAATANRPPTPAGGVHWHTRVQAAPSPGEQASQASDAASSHDAAPNTGLALTASASPQRRSPADEDAAVIRRIVEHWRARPLPPDRQATAIGPARPWRIAVLANARRHLAPVVAELSRAGITYRAVKVEALDTRPEVLDAFALTRALHHPADRAAWFAVLRAPWCGLDAADLLALASEGEATHTKSTVPQLVVLHHSRLSTHGQRLLRRAWPMLQHALEQMKRNPLKENVYRVWISLGGAAGLQPTERANAERYFTLLEDMEHGGALDLPRLKRRLRELYAEPAEAGDAVELMTIHSAKGLEWDVVLVPELGRQGQRESSRLLNWLELDSGTDPAVLLAPIQGKGDTPSPLYQWLNKVHCRRLEAERKRVFYVACTRAREELHLFATARQTRAKLDGAPGSLLHACWPAAAPHFAKAASPILSLQERLNSSAVLETTSAWPGLEEESIPLALAAEAAPLASAEPVAPSRNPYLPRLTRLPLCFDPQARFREAAARRLPYTPAAELPHQQSLTRPEGSPAVRALGNVVHRYLEQLAFRLAANVSPADLQAELPNWLDRLSASLRGEGLPPAEASREAGRALTLLTHTLADPAGLWLLSPHPGAASERALATAAAGMLRVDRTFLAGDEPHAAGDSTLWVVDFKTSSPGGRSLEAFLAAQRETYGPQLARYAEAFRAAAGQAASVRLGLYFPAIPRLIHWPAIVEAPGW